VIFRSPGIRGDLPEICAAMENGAVLSSEMELFLSLCPCPVLAVTGSDGKTTSTTLTGIFAEIAAKKRGGRVFVGGNIGTPLLPRLPEMTVNDLAVMELSSFQLMTMGSDVRPGAPLESGGCAVITNITPNHLNWHTDMAEYTEAKTNIFHVSSGRVILNADNSVTRSIGEGLPKNSEVIYFTRRSPADVPQNAAAVLYADADAIWLCRGGEREKLLDRSDILLPGDHNCENYMAAIAAACLGGEYAPPLSKEEIVVVASSFPGVEHRFEFVRELAGVKFYNSSIDSTPSRTIAALAAAETVFRGGEGSIVLICCGKDKGVPFDSLAAALAEKSCRVRTLVLTGAAADKIAAAVAEEREKNPDARPFDVLREADFESAVRRAASASEKGGIVLLSPACTSFDVFRNFEERGREFKRIVGALV